MLVEPLVAAAVAAVVMAGVAVTLAQAARWVMRANARAETYDTADVVAQSFTFDLRGADWDPSGTAGAGLRHAAATELEVHADRDGDGVIDAASAERLRWRWSAVTSTLSRVVGNQSMPLATGATAVHFDYRDTAGATIAPSPSGLAPGELDRVRAVTLSFTLGAPGGGAAVRRSTTVTLRGGEP